MYGEDSEIFCGKKPTEAKVVALASANMPFKLQ